MKSDLLKFHLKSKLKKIKKDSDPAEWPEEWKKVHYKGYVRLKEYLLPKPGLPETSYMDALMHRNKPQKNGVLSKKILSSILYSSAGLKEDGRRFYPSAGELYPLELYFVSLKVDKLNHGAFHYYVKNNSLEFLVDLSKKATSDLFKDNLQKNTLGFFIITSIFKRNTIKYHDRGYRYILEEAGHISENLILTSSSFGIDCKMIDIGQDEDIENMLDIDGMEEAVLQVLSIG